jgi:hypothetical protein
VSNKYNYAGEVLETKQKHTSLYDTTFMIYFYEYDEVGRLLKLSLSLNQDGSNPTIINNLNYNELGQVYKKDIHKKNVTEYLQSVDFTYDIQGKITKINDPDNLGNDLFGMKFNYNTYKNGNISAISWNSKNLNSNGLRLSK